MLEYLETLWVSATTFPTIVFTVLMGLLIVYWLISLVTGGGADSAIEGTVEGAAEGMLEGLAEGTMEGAVEGVADGAAEAGIEAIEGGGLLSQGLLKLGITVVPVTLVGTLVIGFSWFVSLVLSRLLGRHIGVGTTSLVVGGGIIVVALALGMVATAWAVRPLKPLFSSDKTMSRHDLIGCSAILATSRVDETFGQAEFDDGEAGLLLQVRCRADNNVTRGEKVRIVRYDVTHDLFEVIPLTNETEKTHDDGSESA